MNQPIQVRNKRITVMGLGRFGGGIGVARWLCGEGARVLVTDKASATELATSVGKLRGLPIDYHLGGHDDRDLDGCELLVVNPAVDKSQSPLFRSAVERGVPWTSEMNLFLERCPARLVGITGTVGKSTTTAMLGSILEAAEQRSAWPHGRVWIGGNIGESLLDRLPLMQRQDIVVLELSSFQLEDAASIKRSPNLAAITNIRDNHLDRHGNMAEYASAKANIFRFQKADDVIAVPDDPIVFETWPQLRSNPRVCRFRIDDAGNMQMTGAIGDAGLQRSPPNIRLAVPGRHNLENAATAVTLSSLLSVDGPIARRALADFTGLPHRLELVAERRGVRYVNDSKATSPEATITAIQSFDAPLVVIVGGSDKGASFDALARELTARAAAVICLGQTGTKLAIALGESRGSAAARVHVEIVADLPLAIRAADRLARPGHIVLLSPACASFDQFLNFEQRGDAFRRLVHELA